MGWFTEKPNREPKPLPRPPTHTEELMAQAASLVYWETRLMKVPDFTSYFQMYGFLGGLTFLKYQELLEQESK